MLLLLVCGMGMKNKIIVARKRVEWGYISPAEPTQKGSLGKSIRDLATPLFMGAARPGTVPYREAPFIT